MKIDNYALTTFQACPAKFKLGIIEGWRSRAKSPALSFGAAFHEGLAKWYSIAGSTGERLQAALAAIEESWEEHDRFDDYRTLERCKRVMIEYVQNYSTESFKVLADDTGNIIECTFTLETGMYLDCGNYYDWKGPEYEEVPCGKGKANAEGKCENCNASCEPIEYGGIFDGVIDFNGQFYIFEHKTTSQMGPAYFKQFKPNNQVTGYIWAARLLTGQKVRGALVNAIAVTKTGTRFDRSYITRNDTDINRWLGDLRSECNSIARHKATGEWPYRTPSCLQYGECTFHRVHTLSEDHEQQAMLEQDYVRQIWDYEHRDEAPNA